jgi:hypothetical protein
VDKGGIEGWGQPLYNEVVNHAIAAGMNAAQARGVIDPGAIKLMPMAMLYAKGSKAAAEKVVKAKTSTAKVLRPSPNGPSKPGAEKREQALSRLKRTGNEDDAAAAFFSTFGDDD